MEGKKFTNIMVPEQIEKEKWAK